MSSENNYVEGEKILCYHGPLIYEAKCMKIRTKDNIMEYYIHYKGWSKNWDEWVTERRILKYNAANVAKAKSLTLPQKETCKRQKSSSKSPKTLHKEIKPLESEGSVQDPDSRSSTPSIEGKTKSEKVKNKTKEIVLDVEPDNVNVKMEEIKSEPSEVVADDTQQVEEEPEIPAKISKPIPTIQLADIKFNKMVPFRKPEYGGLDIPENLRLWLTEDDYQLNRLKRLTVLPAEITVSDILRDFKEFRLKTDPDVNQETLQQKLTELDEYFCICLGAFLLFKYERAQYSDMLENYPRSRKSTIYGAIHFLRLLSKTSTVLDWLPTEAIVALLSDLGEVVQFLSQNESKYFSTSLYGIAAPEYHRRAL